LATIVPAIGFSSLSLVSFYFYIERKSRLPLILSALLAGLTVLIRYDMGCYLILAEVCTLLFFEIVTSKPTHKPSIFRHLLLYGLCSVILPALYIAYMVQMGVFSHFIESLLSIKIIGQHSYTGFPTIIWDPLQIFHGGIRFISKNQFYISPLIYFFSILLLMYTFFKKQYDHKQIYHFNVYLRKDAQ